MQVIEIEDSLAVKINKAAQSENKSLKEFVDSSLREVLKRIESRKTDEEKVKKFIESYEKFPQQLEEYEIWQDEQVWSES
ncbi:MAG: hypothetical protein M3R14_05685 [Acidobacteriota bacterium]|nr:hypothetical protein [Acidobacteriota bacterium]